MKLRELDEELFQPTGENVELKTDKPGLHLLMLLGDDHSTKVQQYALYMPDCLIYRFDIRDLWIAAGVPQPENWNMDLIMKTTEGKGKRVEFVRDAIMPYIDILFEAERV